jgi:hypothetical protein
MSKTFSMAQRLKRMKAGDSFLVKTYVEREAYLRLAKSLRSIDAIPFNITTRATDGGFNVIAVP